MSSYNIQVNWAGKDSLLDTDPEKVISGADFDEEFTEIRTVFDSKADVNGDATEAFNTATAAEDSNTTVAATTQWVNSYAAKTAYPVGSIYLNATDSTNPATLFGFGTWVAIGAGRMLVGIDTGDTDFDTAGETGGSKTHTLTIAEMPAHTHTYQSPDINSISDDWVERSAYQVDNTYTTTNTSSTGGGNAHSILNPYLVVYMWKRTA